MSARLPVSAAWIALATTFSGACATAGATRPQPFPSAVGAARSASSEAPAAAVERVPSPPASTPLTASALIASALDLVGTPYRLGGQTPATGFDCSGLVSYVTALHGIALPRTAAQQYGAGSAVDRDEVAAGDLIFFSTVGPGATHVGIVISTDGEPRFVHAPADGASVRIERFDTPYWQKRWVGARRILN